MESVLEHTKHSGEETLMRHYEFEPLVLQHKKLSNDEKCYRVYRTAEDYVEVDADSAYEAMQISEIEAPVKIARFSIKDLGSLTNDMMAEEKVKAAPKEKATASKAKPKAKSVKTKSTEK